jgi:predicted nucleic acid-binding protein
MQSNSSRPILLDTSVIAKWFLDETDSASALTLRRSQRTKGIEVALADLSYYELANVLRFRKAYSEKGVHRAITDLKNGDIPVIPFDLGALHIAIENAYEYGLSLYDAYFVALADLEGMRLVTADRQLVDKVQGHSDVITLGDYTEK